MSYAGLLVGDGTAYELASVEGLADQPDLRTSDRTRLRRHGMLPGDDFLDGRSLVVTLEVFGADDPSFQAAIDALKLAFRPGNPESPVVFQVPGVAGGGQRRISARPRKLALPVDIDRFFYRQPIATIQLDATDPRLYDDNQLSLAANLAAGVPGLTWNLTWPLSWGGASTSGSVFATNAGTFPTPLLVRFDGPVTNPGVERVITGER